MANMFEFMTSRGIAESVINKMIQDKIDSQVVCVLSDADLAKYIPHYGDRQAILHHCRKTENPTNRKMPMLERLKEKLKLRRSLASSESIPLPNPSSNSCRRKRPGERAIEMGWLNYDSKQKKYKQVRTARGGGTRMIWVPVSHKKSDLLELGSELFLGCDQDGKGQNFNKDYCIDLYDFKQSTVPPNSSVDELYDSTKLKMLRFYVATKLSTTVRSEDGVEGVICNGSVEYEREFQVSNYLTEHDYAAPVYSPVLQHNPSEAVFAECSSTESLPEMLPQRFSVTSGSASSSNNELPAQVLPSHPAERSMHLQLVAPLEEAQDNVGLNCLSAMERQEKEVKIFVQRGHALRTLISTFSDETVLDCNITVVRVMSSGKKERGVGTGVMLDCIAEFWNDFYNFCTNGCDNKVPVLRHDFQILEWKAVARVLLYGWRQYDYLPVCLAKPFLEQCISGKSSSSLIEAFFLYLSRDERNTLSAALTDIDSVDTDELMDVLGMHGCRNIPTKSNLKSIVEEIAHKELLQQCAYVVKCWQDILGEMKFDLESGKLMQFYSSLVPTASKVIKILEFPANDMLIVPEVHRFLKKYIRELCDVDLRLFLRFCTGSDLLTSSSLKIQYNSREGLQCHPVAHTCGNVLELPITYDTFQQFRTEFNSILHHTDWEMDIV